LADGTDADILNILDDQSRLLVESDACATFKALDAASAAKARHAPPREPSGPAPVHLLPGVTPPPDASAGSPADARSSETADPRGLVEQERAAQGLSARISDAVALVRSPSG
jgi:hypothetical protein